jgi:hypothetical protein
VSSFEPKNLRIQARLITEEFLNLKIAICLFLIRPPFVMGPCSFVKLLSEFFLAVLLFEREGSLCTLAFIKLVMLKALMSDGDHAKVQMQRYYDKKAASIKLCDSRYPALGSKTFSLLNIAITTWET